MAKFWSKALFYKEWKNAYWMTVFLTGWLLKEPIYTIMASLSRIKTDFARGILNPQHLGDWFGDLLVIGNGWLIGCVVITIALVISLFSHDRQGTTGDLIASMPFSRQQIIGTKWLTGALVIAIPFGVVFLLLTGLYWTNTSWINTSYVLLVQWAFLGFLFFLTFYTFLFFVQTVMGNNAVAGVVGAICTVVPEFLVTAIPSVIRELFALSYTNPILRTLENMYPYTWWPRLMEARVEYLPPNWDHYYYVYTHYGLRIVIMVLLIAGLYALSQLAFAKNPLERNGQLLIFRVLEPVLIWGFAVCLGLLIVGVFGLGYGAGRLSLAIYLVLGTAVGYWIAKKTVVYYRR